ncbi:hypothetical protein PRIPAC_81664, partial [Pristionchus pacificus]|uniref:Uncharacterized protein n=1 Tax=Pristionchus pacificus TaxID=54126 RepID=A0A2A6BH85_PRIPA
MSVWSYEKLLNLSKCSQWSYDEIDYNRRLHVATLIVSLPIAVFTYPLQIFISYRLLTRQINGHIYKLIILNGLLGIFQFLVHIFTRQFPAFYEFSFIYAFLMRNQLEWIAAYLMGISYTVQIHCAFLISLNRFLTFRPEASPWLRTKRVFKACLTSNLILPLFFDAFPPIFAEYNYVANTMANGRTVYRPELPLRNLISIAPPFVYGAVLATSSYLFTGYVVYQLISLRKMKIRLNSSMNNASERGLAFTSISTMIAQVVFVICFTIMLVYKTKEAAAFSIIPLTLNSAAPFWVLLATVPTVRQLLPEIDLGRDIAKVDFTTMSLACPSTMKQETNQEIS